MLMIGEKDERGGVTVIIELKSRHVYAFYVVVTVMAG